MQKSYFHNSKLTNENKDNKKLIQTHKTDIKSAVDINILLNRVKIEHKKEIKRKIIHFSLLTLALSIFGTFIVIVK